MLKQYTHILFRLSENKFHY